ncbi:S8 family serine peptidase [Melissospora conviva]|uniref:S8 family serine peptidase n=1 Tax=Melissospora conviva TaxID=3388432 RepID=UPI003B7F7588
MMRTNAGRRVLRSFGTVVASLALVTGGVLVAPAPASADTVRGLQWYLDSLRIPEAHKISKGRGVTVAVVDSGVDASHPALAGRVLPGAGFGASAGSDGRRDADTDNGHGTAMAGLIAGIGGSDTVQLGIAPEAKILPVATGKPGRSVSEVAQGIRWAVDSGADIVNISLRTSGHSQELVEAVEYALARDVVVVAPAGNTVQSDVGIGQPASIPGVIAVTGTGRSGKFHSGSAYGRESVLATPIEDIIAPVPTSASHNGYGVTTGTSSAAAIVSGIAALVLARYPDLDAANVVNRLIRTSSDLGPAGRDDRYGFGAVDPVAALKASVPSVQQHPLIADRGDDPEQGGVRPEKTDDGEPWLTVGVTNRTGAVIQVLLCLLVPIAILLLVFFLRRGSRGKAPAASAPPGFGGPGHPGRLPSPPYGPTAGGYGPPPGRPMWQPPAGGPELPPVVTPYPGQGMPAPAGGQPPASQRSVDHPPPAEGGGRQDQRDN